MQAVYVNSNTFRVAHDRTADFTFGRRVKFGYTTGAAAVSAVLQRTYVAVDDETAIEIFDAILNANLATVVYGVIAAGELQGCPIHNHDNAVDGGELPYTVRRALFRYKDGDEVYIGPCRYLVQKQVLTTGRDKRVYWLDSEVTFVFGASGSNPDSDNLPTSGYIYLYIDESAAAEKTDGKLDASCFIAKTTAPSFDASRYGYYSGDDLCVFGIPTDSNGLMFKFCQINNEIQYQNVANMLGYDIANNYDLDTTWVTFAATAPAFAKTVKCYGVTYRPVASSCDLRYRMTGSGDATGNNITKRANSCLNDFEVFIPCDGNRQIDLMHTISDTDVVYVQTAGFLLPEGM